MLRHENIITAHTENFMDPYPSENTPPEFRDILNYRAMTCMEKLNCLSIRNEEAQQKSCSIEISHETDFEKDRTKKQKIYSVKKRRGIETSEASVSGFPQKFERWLELNEEHVTIKYNAEFVKDVKVTYNLINEVREARDTDSEEDTDSDSSDSENPKEIENKDITGNRVKHRGRRVTIKESLVGYSANMESHVVGVCHCQKGIFCREAIAMKSEIHQFLLATSKRYIQDDNKKLTLGDFIQKYFKQIPSYLQDYFLQKAKSMQIYIESKINVEYLEYCIYNMLHIIYEECVHNDHITMSGQMSEIYISEILSSFWDYDGQKLRLSRDGLLSERPNYSLVVLYPLETKKSEELPLTKYDRLNEPIREWLKEIVEKCFTRDSCQDGDSHQLFLNVFQDIISPELHRGVCEYVELVLARSSVLCDADILINNALIALQNAINMCRVSDEKLGFKDLDSVFCRLSRLAPFPNSNEIFLQVHKAQSKTENTEIHHERKRRKYSTDIFEELSSSIIEGDNSVTNPSVIDTRNQTQSSRPSCLNYGTINPNNEKNQNSHKSTIHYSEQLRFKTYGAQNSEVKFPKESREMHPQIHSDETKLLSNAGAYLTTASRDERYEKERCICSSSPDEIACMKPDFSKSRVKKVPDMYGVVPPNYFWNFYGLAEELVSKGNDINSYYVTLSEIIDRNGLPEYLRNSSTWENLTSNIHRLESTKKKVNAVYDWLLRILRECIYKDGGKTGFHCDNITKQFAYLKWLLKGKNYFEPTSNFRQNVKQGSENLKLEKPTKSVIGAEGIAENKSKRKGNKKTCVSPPTTVLAESDEKTECESIDILCITSLTNQIKDHPLKPFAGPANIDMKGGCEKNVKPPNAEKDCESEYDRLDAIETDSDLEYSSDQSSSIERFEPIDLNESLLSKGM